VKRNVYAPPAPDVDRARPRAHAPGRVIALLYGTAVAATVIARVIAYFGTSPLSSVLASAQGLFWLATSGLAMAWLYAAWKGIPESHRGTISPRRAALSLLIPLYNAYWGIAVNLALCDTLDGILVRARSDRRAPRVLAIAAGAGWLGSFVLSAALSAAHRPVTIVQWLLTPAVTGGLWFAYAIQCDRARDAVARLGDRADSFGAPRLTQLQRQRGPSVLATVGLFVVLFVGFLVVWQLLAPGDRPAS
jgi:hypothetical protein